MPSASEPLQPGEAVRVRGERWRVVHLTSHGACAVVDLAGAEPSNAGRTGRFILPFEPTDRTPPSLDRPRITRRSAWRRAARAALAGAVPAWHSLRAAARADIVLLPYQLEPALAMTSGRSCRLLLADEVGLGKTIQAGLVVAELLARERDARDRFAIAADVIDAGALARAAADLPAGVNPWAIPRVAITSIDFLKRADVIRSLEPLAWDLVAFDEAHALCGRSDRAFAADLVAGRARRVVIITATPHGGDDGAFERLRAIGRLGTSDPLLTFRRSRAEAGVSRARVTRRLSISPTSEETRMHRALRAYAALVSREAPAQNAAAARLAMIVLARRASSSAASLARSVERRIALLGAAPGDSGLQLHLPLEEGHVAEDDEPLEELAARGLPDASAEQRRLEELLALARAVRAESKIAAVRRLLRRAGEAALVFTEYRDTLRHLAAALDVDAAILHGGLTARERAAQARRFTHGDARLLLATDAASEGLNLQQRCRLVINLDVPWTPLRLEQRIGRVDRIGQQRRVHSITFVAAGTTEALVASGLDARSARAGLGAPFGPADAGGAPWRAEAHAEAARLVRVRSLIDPFDSGWSVRPPLTILRPSRRTGRYGTAELWLALRLLFVDSAGAVVWDTVKALALTSVSAPDRGSRAVRGWFAEIVRDRAPLLAAASIHVHEAELALLRAHLRDALSPLVTRELAILERLQGRQARLAAPLVQPGLFDRRAIHHAEAQRRVAEDAVGLARDRVARLQRQCDPRSGERHLLFAVTRSR
jgi:superfamily II DNA or RNA helicase